MSSLIVEICKIDNVEKHPNADRLSIVTVKGWKCIVGLNDYSIGDAVIFIPPDSIMPEELIEEYKLEYLKSKSHRSQGRVKTVKLRGCISQGLVMPLKILNKGEPCSLRVSGILDETTRHIMYPGFEYGTNVAELLGITKYEPPEPKFSGMHNPRTSKKKWKNPNFDTYTDIENVKHYNTVFELGDAVLITEKIHGTNFRAGTLQKTYKLFGKPLPIRLNKLCQKWFGEYEFVYGSHKVQITGHGGRNCFYGEDVYGQIAKRYQLKDIIPKDYIIYGEIYGKGIQKGYDYGLKDSIDVLFFDVKRDGKYLDVEEFLNFCADRDLPVVPVIYNGLYPGLEILKRITKEKSLLPQKIREGVVVKALVEINDARCGRKILKSINEDYLLIKDNTEFH